MPVISRRSQVQYPSHLRLLLTFTGILLIRNPEEVRVGVGVEAADVGHAVPLGALFPRWAITVGDAASSARCYRGSLKINPLRPWPRDGAPDVDQLRGRLSVLVAVDPAFLAPKDQTDADDAKKNSWGDLFALKVIN